MSEYILIKKREPTCGLFLYLLQLHSCHMDAYGSEVHSDAAIEVNEIHIAVSRSFVRPKATFPSLPAFFFSVCCSSLWNIKEMKTLHIL